MCSPTVGRRCTRRSPVKCSGSDHTADADLLALTHQRIDSDVGVRTVAPHVAEISRADLIPAHGATATKRLQRID